MSVFPTCVGMNRTMIDDYRHYLCVPHMRGDEPRMMRFCLLKK